LVPRARDALCVANIHANSNCYFNTDRDCLRIAYAYSYGATESYTNSDSHGYIHNHAECYGNGHSHSYSHSKANAHCPSSRNTKGSAHTTAAAGRVVIWFKKRRSLVHHLKRAGWKQPLLEYWIDAVGPVVRAVA